MHRKRVAVAANGIRRPTSAAAGRGWIPPSLTAAPSPTTSPSTAAAPPAIQSPSVARMGSLAGRMGSLAGSPLSSPASARLPSVSLPQFSSLASARPAAAFSSSINASSFSDLLESSEGFMSYMMDQQHNLPENAHFVGHVGETHNSPIDMEGEEADEDDGDGVRTVVRLNWKHEEDERVMSAWLKHSIDSIKGNNKKGEQYWSDVTQEYNLTTPSNRQRSKKQVKERWHKVNKWTNMFNDCYLKVRRIYTSGYSEDMWLEKAHELYVEDSKGLHFILMNVWNMVRNQAKWISYNIPIKNKRKDMDNDVDGCGQEDFDLPRPMGQKKAKKTACENKGKSKENAINVDELDRFEKIQNGVHENRLKLLEMQGKLNTDKMEVSKIALQRAKEEKDAKLIEKETKMMETYSRLLTQDTSGMADDMKAEHVAAIRCLRMKLFPDLS